MDMCGCGCVGVLCDSLIALESRLKEPKIV